MTIADDAAGLIAIWGAPGMGTPGTFSIVRPSTAYTDGGATTKLWTEVATAQGALQPNSGGGPVTLENGRQVVGDFELFLPNGTDVEDTDRVRPPSWVAGDDEYDIIATLPFPPSHTRLILKTVGGHAP